MPANWDIFEGDLLGAVFQSDLLVVDKRRTELVEHLEGRKDPLKVTLKHEEPAGAAASTEGTGLISALMIVREKVNDSDNLALFRIAFADGITIPEMRLRFQTAVYIGHFDTFPEVHVGMPEPWSQQLPVSVIGQLKGHEVSLKLVRAIPQAQYSVTCHNCNAKARIHHMTAGHGASPSVARSLSFGGQFGDFMRKHNHPGTPQWFLYNLYFENDCRMMPGYRGSAGGGAGGGAAAAETLTELPYPLRW
jgi:hypothetical protein